MNMPAFGTSLSHARIRELAVEAECDPRTVARVLLGETCKSLRAQRACERVLRKAGLLPEKNDASSHVDHDKPTELAP